MDFEPIYGEHGMCEDCEGEEEVFTHQDMTMCASCLADHFDLELELDSFGRLCLVEDE